MKKNTRIKVQPDTRESDPAIWLSCIWDDKKGSHVFDLKDGQNPADPAIVGGFCELFVAYVKRYFRIPPIVYEEMQEILSKFKGDMLDFQVAMSNFLGSVKFRGGRILE